MAISSDPVAALDPAVREWFRARYPQPTSVQARVLSHVLAGEHVLGLSPTGTGKTWAAFLGVLSALAQARRAGPVDGIFALYLSPLKALSTNVRVALDGPLDAINASLKLPERSQLTTATRTGDTKASERARHKRRPPHVLLTTPESLSTLLAQPTWHAALSRVRYVVVDELHALAESKRGALLGLNLERLEALCPQSFVRIGLSATAHPAEELARFLGGVGRPVALARADESREHRLSLVVPRIEVRDDVAPTPLRAKREARPPRERRDRKVGVPAGGLSEERRAQIARRLKVTFPSTVSPRVVTLQSVAAEPAPVEEAPIAIAPRPARELRRLPVAGHASSRAGPEIAQLVAGSDTSLVFTNTRSATERLTLRLRELLPDARIEAHHGSLAAAERARVEALLAEGKLDVCVCSSSLELGIDVGAVDRVVLLSAPKGVARTLQRLGRARHQVGGVAEGALVPLSQLDLVECVATRMAARAGQIEAVRIPRKPLDVLAQTILGAAVAGPVHDAELFDRLRRATSYADLTRQEFDDAVDYLLGKGRVLGHYDEFSKLVRDDAGALAPRSPRVMRDHLQNVGTIASDTSVSVCLRSGRRLGEVEESFVSLLPAGAIFSVAGRPVQLVKVEGLRAYVKPARGAQVVVPRWRGSRLPISASVGAQLLAQRAVAQEVLESGDDTAALAAKFETECALDPDAAAMLAGLYALQYRASLIPSADRVLVEVVHERRATLLFVHLVAGRAANAAIALALARRLTGGSSAAVTAVDDTGVLVSVPRRKAPTESEVRKWLDPKGFRAEVDASVTETEAVLRLFRGVAQVGQLLLRRSAGSHKTPRASQWSASVLYRTLMEYEPEHVLLREARRELLEDELEVPRAEAALEQASKLPITCIELPRPSPLALGLYASATRETLGADDPERLLEELVDDLEARWQQEPT